MADPRLGFGQHVPPDLQAALDQERVEFDQLIQDSNQPAVPDFSTFRPPARQSPPARQGQADPLATPASQQPGSAASLYRRISDEIARGGAPDTGAAALKFWEMAQRQPASAGVRRTLTALARDPRIAPAIARKMGIQFTQAPTASAAVAPVNDAPDWILDPETGQMLPGK